MLFRPLEEKRLFGFKLPFTPGLIPKERKTLISKMAETVSGKLLTEDVLKKELASEKTQNAVGGLFDDAIASLRTNEITVRSILNKLLPDSDITLVKPGSKIGEFVPENTVSMVIDYLHGKLPDIALALQNIMSENPRIDEELSQLTKKIIQENLGRFVGFFLESDKIYKSLKSEFSTFISDPANHLILKIKIHEYVDNLLEYDAPEAENLIKQLLMENGLIDVSIASVLEGVEEENLDKLKEFLMGWINKGVCRAAEFAAHNMDVKGMVEDKMNSFETAEAEEIILSVVHKQLKAITLVGGILGFIIGLAPGIVSLIGSF